MFVLIIRIFIPSRASNFVDDRTEQFVGVGRESRHREAGNSFGVCDMVCVNRERKQPDEKSHRAVLYLPIYFQQKFVASQAGINRLTENGLQELRGDH